MLTKGSLFITYFELLLAAVLLNLQTGDQTLPCDDSVVFDKILALAGESLGGRHLTQIQYWFKP
jgi:hypothetical protein